MRYRTVGRKLIAGNWKMNGTRASATELAQALAARAGAAAAPCDLLICPPACLLETAARAISGSAISLGGQDCHAAAAGAHTGDVSAAMLADLGCSHVILGHSERRSDHGETDAEVRAKAEAALAAGLTPIVCVGETEAQRDAGQALAVVEAQLEGSLPPLPAQPGLVVAYEPVWAIGTGRTPSTAEVAEVHGAIRAWLGGRMEAAAQELRILYGGSMKPANAAELLAVANVDGGLIGGASLKADDFWAIAEACG